MTNIDEQGALRWICTKEQPIASIPLRHHEGESDFLSFRLLIRRPPKRVTPLVRLMRGDQQVVAVQYNRKSHSVVLDNSEHKNHHFHLPSRLYPEDVLVALEITSSSALMNVTSMPDLVVDERIRLPKRDPTAFNRLLLGGTEKLPTGWAPPIGTEISFHQVESIAETSSPPYPPRVLERLVDMQRDLSALILDLIESKQPTEAAVGER